ncbi:APC family permease [Actinoplanes sp. NPDC024001]|uniref:APC family permease n=1 Tax=Actinoplanes sp. NPDC024001 TaxID=3154598 RepID=UPI0033CF3BD5
MESVGNALAPGRIGAAFVAVLGLAAAAPIVTAVTLLPSALAGGAGPLLPLAFAAVALVLLIFCTGFAAMARRAPSAGAAYAYVARGLGRPAGLAAAWLAVAGYQAIQFGLYVLAGVAAAPLLRSWFGLAAPWWAVAAACWAVVALCGTMRVEIAAGVLALLAGAEAAVLAGLAAANVVEPFGDRVTAASIAIADPAAVHRPMLGLMLAAAVLAFAGFESAGTYAEEALRPRRSTGAGAYGAVLLLVLLLGGLSWSMIVAAGPGRVTTAGARGDELLFDLAAERLAPWAVTLTRAMLVAGVLAGLLALHHAIARYLYAMGRERVLPGVLGHTGRRTGAPRAASLTQSLIAGAALAGAWAAGADPGAGAGRWLIVSGALCLLVLLVVVSLAALLHLNRVPGQEGAWTRFFAPVLSTVSLASLGYLALLNLPGLVGMPDGHVLIWAVPGGLAGCLVLGLAHAAVLRAGNPVGYAGIGLGGVAVVVTPHPLDAPEPPRIPRQRTPGAHRPERVEISRRSPEPE